MNQYCTNCGKLLGVEEKFCTNCGTQKGVQVTNQVNQPITQNVAAVNPQVKPETNGLAITGFVLSLVSLLCCGTSSMLALVFSIIGLVESKKKNGAGKGLAIAGIVISSIMLVLLIGLYALGAFAELFA